MFHQYLVNPGEKLPYFRKKVVRFLLWQSQIGKSIEVQCGIDHLGGEMKTVAVEVVLVLDDIEIYRVISVM